MTADRIAVPLHNLRPVGGLANTGDLWVRDDRLWRSAAPLSRRAEASAAIARMGVRTVVDLRDAAERVLTPGAWDAAGLRVEAIPVFRDELSGIRFGALAELYAIMIDVYPEQLALAFSAIAEGLDGEHGVLVHCTAGKDRTGLLSALVLEVLDVPREKVLSDFSLSQSQLGPEYLAELFADVDPGRLPGAAAHRATAAPPELLRTALEEISRRGGAARFLQSHGVSAAEIALLRDALLTTQPTSGGR